MACAEAREQSGFGAGARADFNYPIMNSDEVLNCDGKSFHSLGLHDDGELRFCAHCECVCVEHNSGQERANPEPSWMKSCLGTQRRRLCGERAAGLLFARKATTVRVSH